MMADNQEKDAVSKDSTEQKLDEDKDAQDSNIETASDKETKTTDSFVRASSDKEEEDPVHVLQLSQPFFVSDTIEDDVSMIIPPTPADPGDETVPLIIPSTPPEREIEETTTLITESMSLSKDETVCGFKRELSLGDADEEEEDEWTKPTQPIFPLKQDAGKYTGNQNDDDDDDETFAETVDILDSGYDLATQEQNLSVKKDEKLDSDDPNEADWNLQLTASQATQSVGLGHNEPVSPENTKKEALQSEGGGGGGGNNSTICISEDDEKESSTNAAQEKEGMPEEVLLFAEIESIVKGARASEMPVSQDKIDDRNLPPETKASDEHDSDDEIAPSQTSSSIDNLASHAKTISPEGSRIPVPESTAIKDSHETGTDLESHGLTKTVEPSKVSEEECEDLNKTITSIKKVSQSAKSREKKIENSETNGESIGPEVSEEASKGVTEASIKSVPNLELPDGSNEIMLPPYSISRPQRTPQKRKYLGKKSAGSLSKLDGKSSDHKTMVHIGTQELKLNVSSNRTRLVGSFTDNKSLVKILRSVGLTIDDEDLKSFSCPSRSGPESNILKEKVLRRIFIKENKLYEEFHTVEDDISTHSKTDISPVNSSSTTASTKTSSFVSITSGEMGDISSCTSSKSQCSSSSGVQLEGKDTPEMSKMLKLQNPELFHSHQIFPHESNDPSPISGNVSSQDDFKNPIVMLSPLKSGKKETNKKLESSTPLFLAQKSKKKKQSAPKNLNKRSYSSTHANSDTEAKQAKKAKFSAETSSSSDSTKRSSGRKPQRNKKADVESRKQGGLKDSSNKIDIPDDTCVITEEKKSAEMLGQDTSEDMSSDTSPFGSILPGVRVMARWKDGYYYPGVVQKQEADRRWCVQFDDGAVRIVLQDNLLKIALLQVGTSVLALSPDGYYDPGIVSSHYRDGKESGYVIEQQSGVTRRYQRSSVILSTEQAKLITNARPVAPPSLTINLAKRKNPDPNLDTTESSASESLMVRQAASVDSVQNGSVDEDEKPLTSGQKVAKVKVKKNKKQRSVKSTSEEPVAKSNDTSSSDAVFKDSKKGKTVCQDNVVGGKRKRKSSVSRSDAAKSPPPKPPRTSKRKNPDPNLDTTESSATESRMVQQVTTTDSVQNGSVDEDEKPLASRQKIAKVKVKKNKKQHSVKSASSEQPVTKSSDTTSSEDIVKDSKKSMPEEKTVCQDPAPVRSTKLFQGYAFLLSYAVRKNVDGQEETADSTFDKDHLCKLILASGGLVFDTFEEAQKCTKRKVILLANTYLRTIKYIQCVAANIPCIQHFWVQNCYLTRKILERQTYVLHTGFSLVHNAPIHWHGKTDIFKGLKIVITAEKKNEFVNIWTPVLLAAKADLVQKWNMPSFSVPGTSFLVDLIVTNATCPSSILNAAKRGKIPVVSSEYIIQCIICGYRLSYDDHPKFKYDFKE